MENLVVVSVILVRVEKLEDQGVNIDYERDLKRYEKIIELLCKSLDSMRWDYRVFEVLIIDLQCCLMKMNFIFIGIGGEIKDEDMEDKFCVFLYYELGIDEYI